MTNNSIIDDIYFYFFLKFYSFSTSFIVDIPVDKITRPLYFFKLSNNGLFVISPYPILIILVFKLNKKFKLSKSNGLAQ